MVIKPDSTVTASNAYLKAFSRFFPPFLPGALLNNLKSLGRSISLLWGFKHLGTDLFTQTAQTLLLLKPSQSKLILKRFSIKLLH